MARAKKQPQPTDEVLAPTPSNQYDATEATNATIANTVADKYRDCIAYVQNGQREGGIDRGACWKVYQKNDDGGAVWTAHGAGAKALELIEQTVREMLRGVTITGDRERMRNYLNALNRLPAIRQVCAAKMERDPADFDANPYILNLRNGVLDLQTLKMRPPQPSDMCSKQAQVRYDAEQPARAPQWEKCLHDYFPDEPAVITFLQDALGYSMLGENPEHLLFVIEGKGGNGKSTVIETVLNVLGSYSGMLSPDVLVGEYVRSGTSRQPEVYALRNNRPVLSSEPKRGVMNSHRLKSWTGDKTIQIRCNYGDPIEMPVTFTLWLMTNQPPEVTEHDDAVRRRMVLIPFREKFLGDDRVIGMGSRLLETERDGIFAWTVKGLRHWRDHGLQRPEAITQAIEDWLAGDNLFEDLFGEVFVRGSHARDYVPTARFTEALTGYVEEHAADFPRTVVNRKFIADMLRYCGLESRKIGGECRVYGVKLNATDDELAAMKPSTATVPLNRDLAEACFWVMREDRGMKPADIAYLTDIKPGSIYTTLSRMAEANTIYKDDDGWRRYPVVRSDVFAQSGELEATNPWYSKLLLHRLFDLALMSTFGSHTPDGRFTLPLWRLCGYRDRGYFGTEIDLHASDMLRLAELWVRHAEKETVRVTSPAGGPPMVTQPDGTVVRPVALDGHGWLAERYNQESHHDVCLSLKVPPGWMTLRHELADQQYEVSDLEEEAGVFA